MGRAPEDNRDSASLSLMRAASDGDVQAVRSLLAAGADVNATNQGGQTALMLAALMGNRELVKRLLEAGANPALQDRLGLTALEWATRRGFSEVSQLLTKVSPTIDRPAPRATSASASTDNETKSRPAVTRDLNTQRLHPSKEVFNISPSKSDEALDKGLALPVQAEDEERSISSERPVEPPSVVTNSAPPAPKASAVETDSQQSAVASAPPPPLIAEQPKMEAPATPAPPPIETESERLAVASAPPPPLIAEQPKTEAPATPAPTPVETESERFAVASASPPPLIAEQPKTEAPSTPVPTPIEIEAERLAVAPAPPPPPITEQPKMEAPPTPTPAPVETQSQPVASSLQPAPTTEQPIDADQILGAAAVFSPQTSATELGSPTYHPQSGEQIVQSEEDEEETLTRPRVATPPPEITLPKAVSAPPEATRVSKPAPTRPTQPPPSERVAAFDSSPLGLSTRAGSNESEDVSNVKRCPKCDTIYRNTHLLYCTRDYATLISIDETKLVAEKPLSPSFTAPLSDSAASQSSTPVAVWLLIAFVLGASAFGAYRLTEYFSRTETPGPVAAKPAEAPVEVKKPFFSVGGALAGMELNVPAPEYPAEVQSAGLTGPITVRVRVNRNGKVISASAASGDQRLRTAAVKAARQATFAPDKLAQASPRSGIVSGSITYEFTPQAGATTSSATAPANGASPGAESGTSSTAETGGSTAPTNLDPNSPLVDAALAGAAVNVPGAEYPARAKRAGTGGTIIVTIRVNRAGKVVSWRSSSGDSQLRAAAIKAARKATFDRDKLPGNDEVVGTITYNFTP